MDWIFGWIASYFDTLDVIVMSVIAAVGTYMYFKYRSDTTTKYPTITPVNTSAYAQKTDRSFIGRMKSEDRQVRN